MYTPYILTSVISLVIGCVISYYLFVIRNILNNNVAEEEIISIVNESTEKGMIEESEAEMINNIFEFGDKAAKDIMTDRSNIIAFDITEKLEDVIEVILDSNNSRFPVYDDNIDHIVGILHIKDAIIANRDKNNRKKSLDKIDGIYREVKFIPETRKIDSLFSTMRSARLQIVVVIDEYGQTSGVVSMRDILEEIVGNIDDEGDDNSEFIVAKEDNKYVVDGLTRIEDIEDYLDIEFDDNNFETINGYLISKLEHIPDKKEKFEYNYCGFRFKVLSVENKMIKQVLITKEESNTQTDSVNESSDE